MPFSVDLKWIVLVPALIAVSFMIWVFLNLARDIHRERRQYWGFAPRRRDRNAMWE